MSTLLTKTFEDTEIKCDDNEQYSRRSCLRIHGIKIADDEDTENVMGILKTCYSDVGLDFDEHGGKFYDFFSHSVQNYVLSLHI